MKVNINIYRRFYPMKASMKQAIELFEKNQGILRTHEAIKLGIHPRILYKMRDQGILEQLTRGVFRLTTIPDFSEPDLVLISKKIPHGVICLISALSKSGNPKHLSVLSILAAMGFEIRIRPTA